MPCEKASLIRARFLSISGSAPLSMTRHLPLPARRSLASTTRTSGSGSFRWIFPHPDRAGDFSPVQADLYFLAENGDTFGNTANNFRQLHRRHLKPAPDSRLQNEASCARALAQRGSFVTRAISTVRYKKDDHAILTAASKASQVADDLRSFSEEVYRLMKLSKTAHSNKPRVSRHGAISQQAATRRPTGDALFRWSNLRPR